MVENLGKELTAIILVVSLVSSLVTYPRSAEAVQLFFIDITPKLLEKGFTDDTPIGINCGDLNFVYITIDVQGLLAKVDILNRAVIDIIDDPDTGALPNTQNFFSIERDPNSGSFFINEKNNGKLWRFDPNAPPATAWTRIPIVQQVTSTNPTTIVNYPEGFAVSPVHVTIDIGNNGSIDFTAIFNAPSGTIVFANGNIWVGLRQVFSFPPPPFVPPNVNGAGVADIDFKGLVKVNPQTLAVQRIDLKANGVLSVEGLTVDSDDPTILWFTDPTANKVFKFDTKTQTIVGSTASLGAGSNPKGIVTSSDKVFVALNKVGAMPATENSLIAQIDKSTLTVLTPIDTGAPNTVTGTFTVFLNNNVLVWTDGSSHVGTVDLITGEKTVENTETNTNNFGCIPIDGEFWFAGKGSAKVGILPNSKFSGGRPVNPTGGGSRSGRGEEWSDPNNIYYDSTLPTIGEVFTEPGSIKVFAEIHDNVGVKDVNLVVGTTTIHMERVAGNPSWWEGVIPSDVASGSVSFKVVALDYNDNRAEYSGSAKVEGGSAINTSQNPGQQSKLTFTVRTKKVDLQPNNFLEVNTIGGKNTVSSYSDTIVIKNKSNEPVGSVRIMLSPEIANSFKLDKYSIQSIEPNGNVTVAVKMLGNPNKDVYGSTTAYDGSIIVMAPNHNPVAIPLKIGAVEDLSHLAYMDKVTASEHQRYRISLLNSLISKGTENKDLDISAQSGRGEIASASDELIIKNVSGKQLNNIRILTSKLGDMFLLDKSNIKTLAPNESIAIQLISKIDSNKYSPKDFEGQIIVIADNGLPTTIPVRVKAQPWKDSMNEYELRIVSNETAITKAVDSITIKNIADRAMDSVKLILPTNLERVLSLSESSFQTIAPNSEVTVDIKLTNIGDKKEAFMQNYNGELTVVSEHHNVRTIPIHIEWKKVETDHFTIYARSGYETTAKEVADVLEKNYQQITSRFGTVNGKPTTRTIIYVASTMDEMKLVNASGKPYYSYADDTIFVCACDDAKNNAMIEFAYKLILNSNPSFYNREKIMFDKGNWLMDGLSKYIASTATTIVGEDDAVVVKKEVDAYKANPSQLEWYGAPTLSQEGASYTFVKYLSEKYGDRAIVETMRYLGAGQISNHRCDTLEKCAVLQAVYKASGLDINNKRYALNFDEIVKGWHEYVQSKYSVAP